MEAEMSIQVMKIVFFAVIALIILAKFKKLIGKVLKSKVVLFIGGYFLGKLFVKLFGNKIRGGVGNFANFTEDAVRNRVAKEVNDFGRKK